ncbi:MAG: hypothetical protein ACFE68_05830 [Candidatus Hodarchaeota archaeon]
MMLFGGIMLFWGLLFASLMEDLIGGIMMLFGEIMPFWGLLFASLMENPLAYIIFWTVIFGVGVWLWETSKPEKGKAKMQIGTLREGYERGDQFCPNCGRRIGVYDRFCPNCSKQIKGIS